MGKVVRIGSWIMSVLGFVSIMDGLWGPIWPTPPDFIPAGADPGAPFSLPFVATNRSFVFSWTDATFFCNVGRIELIDGSGITGGSFQTKATATVPPKGHSSFYCGMAIPGPALVRATIRLEARYSISILGIKWQFRAVSDSYTWAKISTGGMWIMSAYPMDGQLIVKQVFV